MDLIVKQGEAFFPEINVGVLSPLLFDLELGVSISGSVRFFSKKLTKIKF